MNNLYKIAKIYSGKGIGANHIKENDYHQYKTRPVLDSGPGK